MKSMVQKQKRLFFGISLVWLLLWIIPWGKLPSIQGNIWLIFLLDMLRLSVALLVFIAPGVLLYFLTGVENETGSYLSGILPIGFTFSVCIIAVIGLTGRILGLSFATVKYTFALVGFIELLLLALYTPEFSLNKKYLQESFQIALRNPPLILALVLATLMTFHDNLFFIDDLSYLAYLTSWQRSTQLGFVNIVHETNMIENVRFWLALYPMGQALLAELSGVPGLLLLSHYLEFLLVPLAVITAYWFGRMLGLSRKAAGFATLIQVCLYTWMLGEAFPAGMWFYQSMAEDKVTAAYILSPVFFIFLLRFLQFHKKTYLFMIFLNGISITLTHPVILFFSCAIACGLIFLSWVVNRVSLRVIIQLVFILVIVLLPYIVIRLSDIPVKMRMPLSAESVGASFQSERYVNVVNHIFYGLNPDVLKFVDIMPESNGYFGFQLFRLTPVILAAFGGIFALFNLKKGPLYWYVFSSVLLVFFVTLPYTGWLIGYLVTARVLPRASWFSPLGLSGVLVSALIRKWLKRLHVVDDTERIVLFGRLKLTLDFLGVSACYLLAIPMLAGNLLFQAQSFFEIRNHYSQLAQVGAYIDENTYDMVTSIALDYNDNQLLPGVSAHSYLISFREETEYNGFNNVFSVNEIHARIDASNTIRLPEDAASSDERCESIQKYNVRYIVAWRDNVEPFRDSLGKCENIIKVVFETNELILLEHVR